MIRHAWLWWSPDDLRTEYRQLIEEGRDVHEVQGEFDRLLGENAPQEAEFQAAADALLDRGQSLPMRADYAYVEPSELDAIRAERGAGPRNLSLNLSDAERRDRIAGAWLGRCAGCLLGKPIEGVMSPRVRQLLERTASGEISDYLWRLPGLTEEGCRAVDMDFLWSFYRPLQQFPGDDDTNYTVMGMAMLKEKGIGFTPSDMANFWMANLPILRACTAERTGYRNFVLGIAPPESGVYRNPYREWIGAQIRADVFGYVALGRPEFAAELAWRDACISHAKNGIYGAMWVAAMLAAACVESDMRRIVEIGLSEVPAKSRLHEAVTDILNRHGAGESHEDLMRDLHARWDETKPHDWTHTVSNAQIVAMGLLYSEGDYEKAITRTVSTCFDTDCNGATVGSIMGMRLGAQALPEKWTSVMNDSIHTDLSGYQEAKISALSEEMFQLHELAVKAAG